MDSKNGKISEAKRPAWFRYLFNFRFWSDEHPKISPQAVVDPKAEIAEDVEIGPFCVVGPEVKIAAGCRLHLAQRHSVCPNMNIGEHRIDESRRDDAHGALHR